LQKLSEAFQNKVCNVPGRWSAVMTLENTHQ